METLIFQVDRMKGPRCVGEEANKVKEKIKGKGETWYKFEENQNYVDPRPKSRLATPGAEENKSRIGGM